MQAFRFYSGVPLLEIIRIEWKHFGPWKFLLAGTPANVLYHTLDICRIYAIRLLYNFMIRHVLWQVKSEERSKRIRTALDCAEYM